ncbi:hypothetical protein [Euzebya sp.]|uniref:putative acetyltransferase n=1 Tax=Euzebya sp. TaxID=1971409 RepID=UPI0035149476
MSQRRLGPQYVVRITPDDVGQRVTIRARRGEAADGPRFDDTIGHLEAWAHGTLRIRRRDGSLTEVPEAALVAGKVVPPAPAPRRRRT